MVTICLQCGDRGFRNAFVYCVKCVKLALHRYCLDVIPETFDEFVYWVCDDCELEAQLKLKLTSLNNCDAGPTPTGDHIVAEEENVNLFSDINEEEEIDLSAVREEEEHNHKEEPAKSNNALEGNDKARRKNRRLRKKALGSTIKSTRRSTRKIKSTKENNKSTRANNASSRKKEKNKERIKAFAGSEKNKKNLGNNNALSCKKENKERAKACKAKGNKGPKQGERNSVFVRSSREKKRKRDCKLPSKKEEDEKGSTEKIVKKRRISSGKSKTKKTKATIPSEKIHNEEKLETCFEKLLVANILPRDGEKDNFTNGDKNNLCQDSPKDFPIMSAEPVAMPIWRGSFDIWNEKRYMLSGVLGHVSILACQKVYDEALQFETVLHLELLPKSDVWPKSFVTSEPTGDNIALYFFPSKKSEQDFDRLVDEMMREELALKAVVQNAELLIFNSSELPLLYWKFQGKYYLWGVFRQKQSTVSNFHPCREELNDKSPINGNDKTVGPTKGPNALSPCSPLSNSVSN